MPNPTPKIILILSIIFFFLIPSYTKAELTHPYVVDEKPQVIFGDSIPVGGHYGLENYVQDYVGGYAHFTFTYTHHQCCYASYPPFLYVTNVDPRTTNTPIQKWLYYPYNIPSFSGIPTDWYLYDIQFDPTGYEVSVRQQGTTTSELYHSHSDPIDIVDTDWVSLVNLHPNYDPDNLQSMAFTPIPVKESISTAPDPVIIIPGIMGSAYKNGEWTIDPIFHVYDNLIETLEANGYVASTTLFTLPYDWKKSNVDTAILLKKKIDAIKNTCACSKVDVVAHSMGGLVARQYAQSIGYENDIDQLIFLGTPHRGAPKDYLTWEAGEIFGRDAETFFLRNTMEKDAKRNGYDNLFDYIHNWPIHSVEELLPTYNYLKSATTSQLLNYPIGYPENSFLKELNTRLVPLLESDINITNIIGNIGANTISTIRIIDSDKLPLWKDGYPENYSSIFGDKGLETGIGDGTVPEYSSKFGNTNDLEIPSGHINIPTDAEEEIYEKIHGGELTTAIKKSIPLRILYAKVFSPIDIIMIAPDGKKIGKDFSTGQEFNEIPGAFYSGFNTDDEYITVPDPLDGEYKIESKGTDNGGEYTISSSYIDDSRVSTVDVTGNTLPAEITKFKLSIINNDPNNPIDVDLDSGIISTITITSPESRDYPRSEKINIIASTKTGTLSLALGTTTIKSSSQYDPFFGKLGTTTLFATSTINNKAIATSSIKFKIIATNESTISDTERSFNLGWIYSLDTKNQLVSRINKAIVSEEKIEFLEAQGSGNKKIIKTIEKLTKKMSKDLLKVLRIDIEAYRKDRLNEQAYNIIKEDLEWLINN